jgi:hypothetical protein
MRFCGHILYSYSAIQLKLCGARLLQTLADTQVAQAVSPFSIDQHQVRKFCFLSAYQDQVVYFSQELSLHLSRQQFYGIRTRLSDKD